MKKSAKNDKFFNRAVKPILTKILTMSIHKNQRIYIDGHRDMVGSAIWNFLQKKGYSNLFSKTSIELDLKKSSSSFF
jgi:hypothetical protein